MAYSISRTPLITQPITHLCILLIAAVMSACVELPSSEDDGATVPEDLTSQQLAALVAYADDDVNVKEDAIVTLSGSSEGGEAPTYIWRQLSGAVITLDDAHSANISFAAPNV